MLSSHGRSWLTVSVLWPYSHDPALPLSLPQNNRALEAAFRRAGVTDASSHNLRKTFATRLYSRGAAIIDVQHLLCHASVKTTEKAYAAFVKNERFKQTIDLLDKPVVPKLKVVK